MTVTTASKPPFKKDDLENEDMEKENGLEKWQVILIIGAATFSILLFTVLVIFGINRGSRRRANKRGNSSRGTRNLPQLHDFDEVIANRYA